MSLYGKKGAVAGHRCPEIEVLGGTREQGYGGTSGQGQLADAKNGGRGASRYEGERERGADRGEQFASPHTKERGASWFWDLEMFKSARRVLVIEPRLTEGQEGRLEKVLGDNLDLFDWSEKDVKWEPPKMKELIPRKPVALFQNPRRRDKRNGKDVQKSGSQGIYERIGGVR